jgi:3-phosphoshikimate 1-carboxyvinyltransferase
MSGKTVVRGELSVPGDKSISHRAVMFAALATGGSRVRGFLHAADTLSTAGMMRALGARSCGSRDGGCAVLPSPPT